MKPIASMAPARRFLRRFASLAAVAVLAVGWAVPVLRADLQWAQKTVELHAQPNDTVLEARFPFTNAGQTPVDIDRVETSCGCTTAQLAQKHYEPGDKGEIVARFTVGDRIGLQRKNILVSTAGQPVAIALTLIVYIPELVHVQPAFVTWQIGAPAESKLVAFEATPDAQPLRDVSVESSNPSLTAALETVHDGAQYQIRVTPQATNRPLFATVTIHCRIGADEKTWRAYAMVQAPLPPPPVVRKPAAGANPPR